MTFYSVSNDHQYTYFVVFASYLAINEWWSVYVLTESIQRPMTVSCIYEKKKIKILLMNRSLAKITIWPFAFCVYQSLQYTKYKWKEEYKLINCNVAKT